jgi:F-type H+-transporting ATPase subunit delta
MNTILARRYAKALLEIGLEDGNYRAYGGELSSFADGVSGAGAEGQLLFSPALPIDSRKPLLEKILGPCGLSPMVANFVRLLNDRGRFPLLPDAAKAYQALADERDGIVRGVVRSAQELGESQFAGIRQALSICTGKKVELEQKTDPSLIGGVVARLGDLEVDGSVRTQLQKLAALFAN